MGIFERDKDKGREINIDRMKSSGDIDGLIHALGSTNPRIQDAARTAIIQMGSSSFKPLFSALANPDKKIQKGAAITIAGYGEPAIPTLLKAVRSGNRRMKYGAALALAAIGDRAVENIVDLLNDESTQVRENAIVALGDMEKPSVQITGILVDMLRDPEEEVRKAAADALTKLERVPVEPFKKAAYYIARGDWDEVPELRAVAIPLLKEIIEEAEDETRLKAIKTLGKIRVDASTIALLPLLKDDDENVRAAAVESLGKISDARVFDKLIPLLKDNSIYVRMETAWALDRLKWRPKTKKELALHLLAKMQWKELLFMGKDAVPVLQEALNENNATIRIGALEVLTKMGPVGEKAIQDSLMSSNRKLQAKVSHAYSIVKERRGEEEKEREKFRKKQEEMLKGSEESKKFAEDFRKMQADFKKHLEKEEREKRAKEAEEKKLRAEEEKRKEELLKIKREAIKKKQEELRKKRIEKRKKLAEFRKKQADMRQKMEEAAILAGSWLRITDDAMSEIVWFDDIYARAQGGKLIEREPMDLTDEQVRANFRKLLETLKDPDPTIRGFAIHDLIPYGEEGRQAIIGMTEDEAAYVRATAIIALGEMKLRKNIPEISRLIDDPEVEVRVAVCHALGRIGGANVLSPIVSLFRDQSSEVRDAVVETLSLMGRGVLTMVHSMLEDNDSLVRGCAARVAGSVGDSESIIPLITIMTDSSENVRTAVIEALVNIGLASVFPLITVLEEGDTDQRLQALETLSHFSDSKSREAMEKSANNDPDEIVRERAGELLKLGKKTIGDEHLAYYIPGLDELAQAKGFTGEVADDADFLLDSLVSGSRNDQVDATKTLIDKGEEGASILIRDTAGRNQQIKRAANEILGTMGKAVMQPALNSITDEDPEIRKNAAMSLGRIDHEESLNALTNTIMTDKDAGVRATAASALGMIGNPDSINPLVIALDDPDERVRAAAISSLEYLDDERAIEPLVNALKKHTSR